MKKKLLIVLIVLISGLLNAKIIDSYGFRIGGGYSNQKWDYKDEIFSDVPDWKDNKLGLCVYLNGEKKISKLSAIRMEIGYIQKGFSDEMTKTDENGILLKKIDDDVVLHDLSVDLGLKITPFEYKLNPYFIIGIRSDYLMGYDDFMININGQDQGVYGIVIDKFDKLTLGGLFGIGFEYNELWNLDFEFNPAFTNNYDTSLLTIKDSYFGMTVGVNLEKLIKR